ncbi:hypothetical protein [Phycicoccus sonneratiae]|uniref:RDD family protein n=1 Tax=Phycicoccus sonneratiae TaxID=2807628 RepID=A0ABS2CNY7_9MICO|nr:hypothetical protein [Phycicoccus sonneraticus]MBM6401600.1 hypothetical protein [Phycicoccus sonneraticus]
MSAAATGAPVEDVTVPGAVRRPLGAVPWVLAGFVAVPAAIWVAIAAGFGLDAPLFFILALILPLVLFGAPFLWALVTRRRGVVRLVHNRGGIVFPATSSNRICYLLMSLGLIALPVVATWDIARVGSENSGVARAFLYAAPAIGIYGLFWLRGWTPTSLTLTPAGVTAHANRTESTLSWDDLPPVDANGAPRLDKTLRAAGTLFPGTMLRSDPDVVADLLELYRTRPDLRRELATGDVLERLRRGDVTTSEPPR